MKRQFHAVLAGLAVAVLVSAAPHAPARMALPFIDDDYAKALAQAKARHLPIFIEAWAPW